MAITCITLLVSLLLISTISAGFFQWLINGFTLNSEIDVNDSVYIENSIHKTTWYPETVIARPIGANGDFRCFGDANILSEDSLPSSSKLNLSSIYLEDDYDKSIMTIEKDYGQRYKYEDYNITTECNYIDTINISGFEYDLCYIEQNVSEEYYDNKTNETKINYSMQNITQVCDFIEGMDCIKTDQQVSKDYYENGLWEHINHSRTMSVRLEVPCGSSGKFNVYVPWIGMIDPFWISDDSNFTNGTFNNTLLNGTFIQLDEYNDTEKELPNNQASDFYNGQLSANMTGNVLLMHLNNDSSVGENDTLVYDFSGNGNNGTCSGASCPTFTTSGKLNGAFTFDGNSDYVNVSNDTSLDLVNFTVATWIKSNIDQDGTDRVIVSHGVNYILQFDHSNVDFQGAVAFRVGGSTWYNSDGPVTISKDTWHYAVGVYDGTFLRFYLDGIEATNRNIGSVTSETGNDLHIGSDLGLTQYFNGTIDEVAIWNRSLSASEIKTIYNRQSKYYGQGVNGSYQSEILDAGASSSWDNISYTTEVCYQCELPNNQTIETGDFIRFANGTGNVGLWHLDNNSAFGENDTLVYDFSYNGNNGTCSGATCPDFITDGKFNGAFNFTRVDTSNGDFIDLGDMGVGESYPFSASGWIKSTYSGDHQIIVSEGNSGTDTPLWNIGIDSSGFGWLGIRNNANTGLFLSGTTLINDGEWHHVVAVYTSINGTLYVDGIEENSGSIPSLPISLDITSIGREGRVSSGDYVNGSVDEVAIFNRTLSAQEVQDMYLRGAVKLNLSVRSCNDSACSGENWIDINDTSPQNLSNYNISNNTHFQYNVSFETEDYNFTPKHYNVTVGYTIVDNPPNVSLILNTTSLTLNEDSIQINCTAVNGGNISDYLFNVTYPNGTLLFEDNTTNTSVDLTPDNLTVVGEYDVSCFAEDNIGQSTTNTSSFNVTFAPRCPKRGYKNMTTGEILWYVDCNGNANLTGNLTLGQKITFALGEIIDNIVDGWIKITGNLNVTNSATIGENLNVTENFTVENFAFVEDRLFVGTGCNINLTSKGDGCFSRNVIVNNSIIDFSSPRGFGLSIFPDSSQTNITTRFQGNASFNATTNVFCDDTNNFSELDKFKLITIFFSLPINYDALTGEILEFINASCVIFNPSATTETLVDVSNILYAITNKPIFAVFNGNDGGAIISNIGNAPLDSFKINIPNSTGEDAVEIIQTSGTDDTHVLHMESDTFGFTGTTLFHTLIKSTVSQTLADIMTMVVEADLSNFNNSDYNMIEANILADGVGNTKTGIEFIGNFTRYIHAGSQEPLNISWYDNTTDIINTTDSFTSTTDNIDIFEFDDSVIYLGNDVNFTRIGVSLVTGASGTILPLFFYCNSTGQYESLNVTDGTSGFTDSGTISFTNPSNRGECNQDINGVNFTDTNNYSYIAIQRTRNFIVTPPNENIFTIAGEEQEFILADYFIQMKPASSPPITCTQAGAIYSDSDLNLPCFCDGTSWKQMDDFSTVCS